MTSATKNEALRLERAATAEKLALEFAAEDGMRRIKRGLQGLTRAMEGEEARERSAYLDRRIREAAGLAVEPVADAAAELAKVVKQNPDSAYRNARLTTKRKAEPSHAGQRTSTAQWERKLQGGRKEPPQWTRPDRKRS
jgi:hypothetical protein